MDEYLCRVWVEPDDIYLFSVFADSPYDAEEEMRIKLAEDNILYPRDWEIIKAGDV